MGYNLGIQPSKLEVLNLTRTLQLPQQRSARAQEHKDYLNPKQKPVV